MEIWGWFIRWYFGDEGKFAASMSARPFSTVLKSLVILSIAFVGILVVAYASAWASNYAPKPEEIDKVSETQSVMLWGNPASNFLNLGNVGTLLPSPTDAERLKDGKPLHEYSVGLILNATPTIFGASQYPSGGIGFSSGEVSEDDIYVFNTTSKKSREIEIGDRIFVVTLFSIKDIGTATSPNYEYKFGVYEK